MSQEQVVRIENLLKNTVIRDSFYNVYVYLLSVKAERNKLKEQSSNEERSNDSRCVR
jgi:hypothetical protein